MTPPRTFALVPAAGKSRRMGRPKLLLPVGGRSVLQCVLDSFRGAGVRTVLVVVGPDLPQLAGQAEQAGASVLRLDEDTADMRATVERGLAWLEAHRRPGPGDAWLLAPADHPALSAAVVAALLRAREGHPDRSLFVPAFEGRRGHPALLGWEHVAGIRRLPPGQGLNAYLRDRAAETVLVAVDSAEVLADLDTPEDYERLLARGS
jgi:CTP:molybdopterin cytidylyltransferase MocA